MESEIQSYLLQVFKYGENEMPTIIGTYLAFHHTLQLVLIVLFSLLLLFSFVFVPIYVKVKCELFIDMDPIFGAATLLSAMFGIVGLPVTLYYYWLLKNCPEMYLLEALLK
jgi:hypothetical protein